MMQSVSSQSQCAVFHVNLSSTRASLGPCCYYDSVGSIVRFAHLVVIRPLVGGVHGGVVDAVHGAGARSDGRHAVGHRHVAHHEPRHLLAERDGEGQR
eukprot:3737016-Pyramimonas_sp.AAC.1